MNTIAPNPVDRKIYTISELNRRAKDLLETHLHLVWVSGEISNFSKPASGHWYLTLKDEHAQVRCAMFRNRNQGMRFTPKAGDHVQVRGRVSLFEGRGDYQVIIEHMEDVGFGQLQKRFEELKEKLRVEGLFDQSKKRSLPAIPKHIALITSPTGAAIRDVLAVLARRFKPVDITVFPTLVQGEGAAEQMIAALDRVANDKDDKKAPIDVVLLCRGGGSIEDLWAFNSEALARKIATSSIPTICGVGHEIDMTIADWAADVRAATPSAAAEILVPDAAALSILFEELKQRLYRALQSKLGQSRAQLENQRSRLKHPLDRIEFYAQSLDHLESRLHKTHSALLADYTNKVRALVLRLQHQHPEKAVTKLSESMETFYEKLVALTKNKLANERVQLQTYSSILHAVSPLATLERGYAIATTESGKIIDDAKKVKQGESISIKLAKGHLLAEVKQKKAKQCLTQ